MIKVYLLSLGGNVGGSVELVIGLIVELVRVVAFESVWFDNIKYAPAPTIPATRIVAPTPIIMFVRCAFARAAAFESIPKYRKNIVDIPRMNETIFNKKYLQTKAEKHLKLQTRLQIVWAR